jgi:glycosyltransferase involved in cell wall biosynthesis
MTPLVSIITPTFNRHNYLPLAAKCVFEQTMSDFEWLVLDDSTTPSEFMKDLSNPRVVYEHDGEKQLIGKKRNRLIRKARANIIAQFDDDDFYGPDYLATMLSVMSQNSADIVKFFGFFLYSKHYNTFGYWDLMTKLGPHWVWSNAPASLTMLTEQNNQGLKHTHLGFGFSYVFRKAVWEDTPFPEMNWNEDATFVLNAVRRFKLTGIHDQQFTCIHVLHKYSTSRCFPQYLIPNFLITKLFPQAAELLAV